MRKGGSGYIMGVVFKLTSRSSVKLTNRPSIHTNGGQQWTGELRSLPPVSVGKNHVGYLYVEQGMRIGD